MRISDISNPRQIALITCKAEIKEKFSPKAKIKSNVFAVSWHTPVSFEPPLYAIAVGKQRYSLDLIKKSKVFVVNFMPYELKKEVLFCGTNSGHNLNKFKETNLEKEKAAKIDCIKLKQSAAFLECHVINEIDAGDHIIFIGKVLNMKLNKQTKRLFQKNKTFTTTK